MSFPAYPSYRDSGQLWLRDVPAHWEVVAGRRLFRQVREPSVTGDQQLSASQKYGIIPQSLLMEREDQKVVLALNGLEGFKHVNAEDFVISLRSFQGGIEHSAYTGCVSPAYTVLRPTYEQVPGYYRYLLKAGPYISALQTVTDGIRDGKNISYEQFGKVGLPLPPLPEQTAIAAFLDRETSKIDALVEEQRRLIELLKEKRQSVISHAVTKGLDPTVPMKDSGVEWLGTVPAHWGTVAFGRVIERIEQGWSPAAYDRDPEEGEASVLRLSAVKDGVFHAGERKALPELTAEELESAPKLRDGDFLLTRANTPSLVGDCAIAEFVPDTIFSDLIYRLEFSADVLPAFALHCLRSAQLRGQIRSDARGSSMTMAKLSHGHIKSWRVALPPLAEQEAITAELNHRLVRFAELIAVAEKATKLLQERRAALISSAVTGKIDVRSTAAQQAQAA